MQVSEPPLQQEGGVGEAHTHALVRHRAFREVLHRRAEFRERILLDDFCGPPQGEYVEA